MGIIASDIYHYILQRGMSAESLLNEFRNECIELGIYRSLVQPDKDYNNWVNSMCDFLENYTAKDL